MRRTRGGFSLLEALLAVAMASMLFIGHARVSRQSRLLIDRLEEHRSLHGLAVLGGRLLLASPGEYDESEVGRALLTGELERRTGLSGLICEVDRVPLGDGVHQVRVRVGRDGRKGRGEAWVLIGE